MRAHPDGRDFVKTSSGTPLFFEPHFLQSVVFELLFDSCLYIFPNMVRFICLVEF